MKVIFTDYTGAILRKENEYEQEFIRRLAENSTLKTEEEAYRWFLEGLLKMQKKNPSMNRDDICLELIRKAVTEYGLADDPDVLHQLIQNHWMYGDFYTDAAAFLERSGMPVYIVSSIGADYIRINLKRQRLHVNGIISTYEAEENKPDPNFYEYALRKSGCERSDVIVVTSNLENARAVRQLGMDAVILVRRGSRPIDEFKVIRSMRDLYVYAGGNQ